MASAQSPEKQEEVGTTIDEPVEKEDFSSAGEIAENLFAVSKEQLTGNTLNPSKNQLKKLLKTQKWEARKNEKRRNERLKKKEKRKLQIEAGEAAISSGNMRKRLKKNTMANSSCKVKVAVDCSFDHLMNEKDISRTVSQLQYCYSANRRSANPLQLYVTGVGGATEERLKNVGVYKSWDVSFHSEGFMDVFPKEDIVYLSSDSDNVLDQLDPSKAYIIGGLVDHNSQKGLCHRLAVEKGLSHAQLPIGDFVKLKSRKVLAINHVLEILLRYTETNNWEEAFYKVIPKRKIMDPSDTSKDSDDKNTDTSMCKTGSPKEQEQSEASTVSSPSGCENKDFINNELDNTKECPDSSKEYPGPKTSS